MRSPQACRPDRRIMSGFRIALTDPFDADALALINASEAEMAALYPPEVRFAFSPSELVAADVRFFLARQDGLALGCCGYAPCDGFAELKRLFVAPDFRGTGVAHGLLEHVEASARREGFAVMRLETGTESLAARALYAGRGYAVRGPFASYTDNGASVFMEKTLGGDPTKPEDG